MEGIPAEVDPEVGIPDVEGIPVGVGNTTGYLDTYLYPGRGCCQLIETLLSTKLEISKLFRIVSCVLETFCTR